MLTYKYKYKYKYISWVGQSPKQTINYWYHRILALRLQKFCKLLNFNHIETFTTTSFVFEGMKSPNVEICKTCVWGFFVSLVFSVEGSSPRFQKRCFFWSQGGLLGHRWMGWGCFLLVTESLAQFFVGQRWMGWGCQVPTLEAGDCRLVLRLFHSTAQKCRQLMIKCTRTENPGLLSWHLADFLALAKIIILELLEIQWRGCASVRHTVQCTLYM